MLNQVQLIGFTGAAAEIRSTRDGRTVAALRVCTSRHGKKDGERTDYPTWHQVEIWSPAVVAWLETRALPKGSKVFVQGEIRNEQSTSEGSQKRIHSKVVVALPGHELRALDKPAREDLD